ncbi:MAG: hypothetical protein ACLP5H_31020 [Desulfomonilaceae bacterium]
MTTTPDFLKMQEEELQAKLEKARSLLDDAQREVSKLEERLLYCRELIESAEKEKPDSRDEKTGGVPKGQTTADYIQQALEKHGPSTAAELLELIKHLGKETKKASLASILSREKGKRFNNKDGKWHLMTKDPKVRLLKL